MSRRETRRISRGRKRPSPRAILASLSILLGLTAVLVGARIGCVRRRGPGPAARAAAPALRDSAAAMSAHDAARMASWLYRSRRAYASLPFYRRVAPEISPEIWDFHLEFATALQLASLETRVGGSRMSAPTRASDERVGLMLESLSELDRAEQAARRPRDRARAIVARAFFLRVWGFPLDAVVELRRAMAIDPTYPDLGPIAELMTGWLRDPTIPVEEMEIAERKARGGRHHGLRY